MQSAPAYPDGTFCWIDLGTPDHDSASTFYNALFGWSITASENPEMTGDYREARLPGGEAVCGIMPLMQEGQPPAWTTYIATEDVDACVERVNDAGGSVLVAPMDVLDFGRMAIVSDPTASVFGLWQPGIHRGADITGVNGAMTWNELGTDDPSRARDFYSAVFGWSFEPAANGDPSYSMILRNGVEIGGMLDLGSRGLDEVPSHWLVYFAVPGADAAVDTTQEKGGQVAFGPVDIPQGRFAVLADPSGAYFAIIQPSSM